MEKEKNKNKKHPVFKQSLTFGQRASDRLTNFCGSWFFIVALLVYIVIWISLNIVAFVQRWDPWPFILLNLTLSCLAAIQAPIILMSQKRGAERDRINFSYDYKVNRKAEREIQDLKKQLDRIERLTRKK